MPNIITVVQVHVPLAIVVPEFEHVAIAVHVAHRTYVRHTVCSTTV